MYIVTHIIVVSAVQVQRKHQKHPTYIHTHTYVYTHTGTVRGKRKAKKKLNSFVVQINLTSMKNEQFSSFTCMPFISFYEFVGFFFCTKTKL